MNSDGVLYTLFLFTKKNCANAVEKIKIKIPSLIFKNNDQYIEWIENNGIEFEKWWWQISVGQNVLNK